MEQTSINNPLEQLKALRQEAQEAQTYEQIRIIHRRISLTIKEVIAQKPYINLAEIAEALGTTVEKQRRGLRLGIYLLLKEINPGVFLNEDITEEKFNSDIDDDLNVPEVTFASLPTVIVPPDREKTSINNGTGAGMEEKKLFDRTKYTIEVLQTMDIDVSKCKFKNGSVEENMIRKTSYVLIKIPQLNKMVLVCDEEGNRTFVVYTIENEEKYINMLKDELKEDPFVKNLKWDCGVDVWKMKLMSLLSVSQPEGPKIIAKKKAPVVEKKETVKMDAEYFTRENLRNDLGAYAKAALKPPAELNTSNFSSNEIVCCNGETVKGKKYITRAGVALKITATSEEARNRHSLIVKKLLLMAGYLEKINQPMVAEYFTSENVKADLLSFAKAIGEKKTPLDLNTNNLKNNETLCCNGEIVEGRKYLNRAGVALGLVKDSSEAGNRQLSILYELLSLAGYDVKELLRKERKNFSIQHNKADLKAYGIVKMDASYYTPENVKADLDAYVKTLGENKTLEDLNTSNIKDLRIVCKNGESLKGGNYLYRAGVLLGLSKNSRDAQNTFALILKTLLKLAGYKVKEYPKMDAIYFTPENVKTDLEAYAKALGASIISADFNSTAIKNKEIVCCNGETVNGSKYLYRAGSVLGIVKSSELQNKKYSTILNYLLRMAGFDVEEYKEAVPKNKEYFTVEHIKADMEAFARTLGEGKTPSDISYNSIKKKEIICCNNTVVKGPTYIVQAGRALGYGKNSVSVKKKIVEILNKLIELAGYEKKVYSPMNSEYFSKENVKADLEAFAQKIGKDAVPTDLNTNNIRDEEAFCSNGESVFWFTYISRAGVLFDIWKNKHGLRKNRIRIIKKLLNIAGYNVEEYIDYQPMEAEYYTKENVRADLDAFAKLLEPGKTVIDINTFNISGKQIICCNGQPMKGQKYINYAGVKLGFGKNQGEAHKRFAEVLKTLKQIAGYTTDSVD